MIIFARTGCDHVAGSVTGHGGLMLGGETQDRWVWFVDWKVCPVVLNLTIDSVPWLPCAVMNDELIHRVEQWRLNKSIPKFLSTPRPNSNLPSPKKCVVNLLKFWSLHNFFPLVVRLFQKSQLNTTPAVVTGVTLPCLKILQNVIYPERQWAAKTRWVGGERVGLVGREWG